MKFLSITAVILAPLLGALVSPQAEAQIGLQPVKVFDFIGYQFKVDAARGRLYVSGNQVEVIDTSTLTVVATLPVSAGLDGMAISADGSKLYVGLRGEANIAVIDLESLTLLPNLVTADVREIEAGLGDRLYAASAIFPSSLRQVSALNGKLQAVLEASLGASGLLQMSTDRSTLYFRSRSNLPSTYERFDVSGPTAVLGQSISGNAGLDLVLSHNGKWLASGTTVRDAANLSTVLGWVSGDQNAVTCFRPDDAMAYQYDFFANEGSVFDTTTFRKVGSFVRSNPDQSGSAMVTDATGRYLFVADLTNISVYDLLADNTYTITGTVGQPFSYQPAIFVAGSDVTAASLPPGLTFDAATRTISGTPTKAGTFVAMVQGTEALQTATAELTLTLYPNARAQNISTRLSVETGDNVLIAGFIISGNSDETVVVRAIGPSLKVNGQPVAGRLGDPMLELYDSTGTLIASNDNWAEDSQGYLLGNLGLQPTNDLEAALFRVLSPGAYTVIIRGVSNTTGIALAEVYDITTPAAVGGSRLANISTRGKVETGDNVMIGGVIVGGDANAQMLIRAIGPSLAAVGVAGPLADPQLTLYNGQGTAIASNDNWRDAQEVEIMATGLAPTDDRESAISTSLAPGAYTAIVSGVGGTSGVGLVEAYNLP